MSRDRQRSKMVGIGCCALYVLLTWSRVRDKVWKPKSTIPEPCYFLESIITLVLGSDLLKKLELFSEYFFSYGIFGYRDKLYILDPKYCQTAINKVEKGAAEYLSNSPLSNSFLGSSTRNPVIRRAIAAIFKKSSIEDRGHTMMRDVEKMINCISQKVADNSEINISNVSLKVALDIVGHVLLDLDLCALEGEQDAILEAMTIVLHKTYATGELEPHCDEFITARNIFDLLSSHLLELALEKEPDCRFASLPSALQETCNLDDAEENVKLFLMAGTETTATAIPIFLHLLAAHPHLQVWKPKSTIPEPCYFLESIITLVLGSDLLKKLEFFSEYFFSYGIFGYRDKLYILDPKYCKTAINKVEKGAAEYLSNSPLSNSFLGSSTRNPVIRRAIAAIFKKSSIEDRGQTMMRDVEKMINCISQKVSDNSEINISNVSLKVALDIVGHVLLDLDLCALEGEQDAILEAMTIVLHKTYATGELEPHCDEFITARNIFDLLSSHLLELALEKEPDCRFASLPSALQETCNLDDAEDNVKLFLMAGTETTATAIPIFLHLLAAHPHLQTTLQREADEKIALLREKPGVELPETEQFIKEVLRLYPVAPYISRHNHTELTIGGLTIPAQSDLRVFTWGIHRSPYLWEDAKQLKPERFSTNHSVPKTWIPFGAGSRICIGQNMAWLEMKLILVFLLHAFSFTTTPNTPQLEFCVDWEHAVIHPRHDVVLGCVPRT